MQKAKDVCPASNLKTNLWFPLPVPSISAPLTRERSLHLKKAAAPHFRTRHTIHALSHNPPPPGFETTVRVLPQTLTLLYSSYWSPLPPPKRHAQDLIPSSCERDFMATESVLTSLGYSEVCELASFEAEGHSETRPV